MSRGIPFYSDFHRSILSSLLRAFGLSRFDSTATCNTIAFVAIICSATGCNRSNPYLTASPSGFSGTGAPANIASPQLTAQITELERRAKLLDDNNRQLTTQLAQSQQQMQLFKERSELMQRQAQDMGNQLQQSRIANAPHSSHPLRLRFSIALQTRSNEAIRGSASPSKDTPTTHPCTEAHLPQIINCAPPKAMRFSSILRNETNCQPVNYSRWHTAKTIRLGTTKVRLADPLIAASSLLSSQKRFRGVR